MSHGSGHLGDPYDMDPRDILAQFSVEWVALRKSYDEVKIKLREVQQELTDLDKQLEENKITEAEHIELYRERWRTSTEIVQVKREVEARLYEIQRQIRAANKRLKEMEEERLRRERIEQEKSNAMIEWMSLKQGFDMVTDRRREINDEMDRLELERRQEAISDDDYRRDRVVQIGQLAELRTLETDIKRRLGELLEIIRG
ncbi:MAG: hypothetical protein JSW61_09455 [Candidatus Thorarchaeota archaeon]|nr:MAG: hypothetical protein JSW61_09455 [Candidatus Thorarchaeota archaeon]